MSYIRVPEDDLVAVAHALTDVSTALSDYDSGGLVRGVKSVGSAEDMVYDLIESGEPAVFRPVWADKFRLEMVRGSIREVLDVANRYPAWRDQGVPGDLELVLRLIDVFAGVDKAESQG